MKRSEMVQIIAEYLNRNLDVDGANYHADNILDIVEEENLIRCTMDSVLMGSGKLYRVDGWEPEACGE